MKPIVEPVESRTSSKLRIIFAMVGLKKVDLSVILIVFPLGISEMTDQYIGYQIHTNPGKKQWQKIKSNGYFRCENSIVKQGKGSFRDHIQTLQKIYAYP
jgi:hypothetical protein